MVGGLPLDVERSRGKKGIFQKLQDSVDFSENTSNFKSRCMAFAKLHFLSNCHLAEFVQLAKQVIVSEDTFRELFQNILSESLRSLNGNHLNKTNKPLFSCSQAVYLSWLFSPVYI